MTDHRSWDSFAEAPTQRLPRIDLLPGGEQPGSDKPGGEQPGSEQPAAGKPRAAWADVAKGVCILLVVLWHVIMKHYLQIDWHISVPLPGAWGAFGEQLLPLRMPVFFTISGMFAVAAVQRPWAVVRRSRIAKFYYLYAIWFTVHTLVLSLVPRFDTLAAHNALDVLEQLTITPTNLWYLIALAVYFVVAKLTRRVPVAVILGAAFLLSAIASAGLLAGPGNRGQLYQNLLFFLIGLRLRPWVEKVAAEATLRMLMLGAVGYLAAMALIQLLGIKQWFGVWPVASVLAVMIGVAAAARLQHWRRPATLLAGLGRQTLPIYVMHMPLLALLHLMLLRPFSAAGPAPQLLLAVLLPVVLTALLVWLCLTLHRGLTAVGASWLFDLPGSRRTANPPADPPASPPAAPPANLPRPRRPADQPGGATPTAPTTSAEWPDGPTRILPVIR